MAFSGVCQESAEILEEQDGDRTICAHKSPSRFFISFNMNLAGCLVRNVRGVENNGCTKIDYEIVASLSLFLTFFFYFFIENQQ